MKSCIKRGLETTSKAARKSIKTNEIVQNRSPDSDDEAEDAAASATGWQQQQQQQQRHQQADLGATMGDLGKVQIGLDSRENMRAGVVVYASRDPGVDNLEDWQVVLTASLGLGSDGVSSTHSEMKAAMFAILILQHIILL